MASINSLVDEIIAIFYFQVFPPGIKGENVGKFNQYRKKPQFLWMKSYKIQTIFLYNDNKTGVNNFFFLFLK